MGTGDIHNPHQDYATWKAPDSKKDKPQAETRVDRAGTMIKEWVKNRQHFTEEVAKAEDALRGLKPGTPEYQASFGALSLTKEPLRDLWSKLKAEISAFEPASFIDRDYYQRVSQMPLQDYRVRENLHICLEEVERLFLPPDWLKRQNEDVVDVRTLPKDIKDGLNVELGVDHMASRQGVASGLDGLGRLLAKESEDSPIRRNQNWAEAQRNSGGALSLSREGNLYVNKERVSKAE